MTLRHGQPTSLHPAAKSPAAKSQKLTDLTKHFLEQLQSAPDGVIDLNEFAKSIGVAKRRVYDITNVLEGVGVLAKEGKNSVRWCPRANAAPGTQHERSQLEADIAELESTQEQLDSASRALTTQLIELLQNPQLKPHLYVTAEDLACLDTTSSTYIALRCATLQVLNEQDEIVPDPGSVQEGHQLRCDGR